MAFKKPKAYKNTTHEHKSTEKQTTQPLRPTVTAAPDMLMTYENITTYKCRNHPLTHPLGSSSGKMKVILWEQKNCFIVSLYFLLDPESAGLQTSQGLTGWLAGRVADSPLLKYTCMNVKQWLWRKAAICQIIQLKKRKTFIPIMWSVHKKIHPF